MRRRPAGTEPTPADRTGRPYGGDSVEQAEVCKVAGDYLAWPTVVTCASGEVLVVFSGDREEHVCPYGKTILIRSGDRGETWTEPVIINSTPLDDRDAGIIELASGTLVMSWFTYATWEHFDAFRALDRWEPAQIDAWARHCSKVPEEARRAWLGNWTRRSTDGGRTWEPLVPSIVSAPHGPVQAASGELLYAGTCVCQTAALRCCWPRPATRRGRGRSRGRCCIRTTIPASTSSSTSRTWRSWPAASCWSSSVPTTARRGSTPAARATAGAPGPRPSRPG